MLDVLLTAKEAALRLGVSVTTLYAWLGLSDTSLLVIRGQWTTIRYYQTGPQGQGRIRIPASEIDRLLTLMQVNPKVSPPRRSIVRGDTLPGITVALGRPEAP